MDYIVPSLQQLGSLIIYILKYLVKKTSKSIRFQLFACNSASITTSLRPAASRRQQRELQPADRLGSFPKLCTANLGVTPNDARRLNL